MIGLGRNPHIGRAVAERAKAPGLRVLVADPFTTDEQAAEAGVELAGLDDLLTRETTHLLDARRLALMKPTAFLVNCARGAIVDLDALAQSLERGELAGAGIDVFDPERLPVDHPLMTLRSTVLTPHVASYSEESIAELQRQAPQNVAAVLAGGPAVNVVNTPAAGLTIADGQAQSESPRRGS